MAKKMQQEQLDEYPNETRLEMIARIAKDLMKRNFTPSEEELDLDSWGFDDD